MIDTNMLNQLKEVFTRLEGKVELSYDQSEHSKQKELVDMLNTLSETSANISVSQSGEISRSPRFSLKTNGKHNGIVFSGIPGGHEFSSLILAILNSDKKRETPR